MKKSLIALAALAATASFAQSTVSISGIVDFAYGSASGSATNASSKLQTVSQSSYTSSTSAINFNIVEDLGGGLRASARYAIDPRAWSNGTGPTAAGALGRHESFVGLSGGFGNLRLGVINSGALDAYGASSPLGTGIGSGFSVSDHTAVSTVGVVRFNNSVRYDTPRVNGFAGSLTFAPGNDDATSGGAVPQITNFGLTYSKGPLNVAFSNLQTSATGAQAAVAGTCAVAVPAAGTLPASVPVGAAGCNTGTAAVAAGAKGTFNYIAANYTMGAARVFAGYGDGDKSAAGGADVKVTRLGATYTMGAVTLLGQYATTKIGTAADRKTTGLRADYALSKRTASYLGYESYEASNGTKTNLMAVGVRHSF